MQDSNYKYVFVCGLARSGTSLLGRNIARLDNCTGFKNTGAGSDEATLAGCLSNRFRVRWCGQVWVRPARAPDRDLKVVNSRERGQTSRELACFLGREQNDLRGENAGQLAYDTISASGVSQLLLRSDQTAFRAGKHVDPEMESQTNLAAEAVQALVALP